MPNAGTSLKSSEQRSFVYFIAIIAALCGLLFGFDTGVISGAMLFIHQDLHLTNTMHEWVVSAVLLGAFLGAIFSGRVSDKMGRRWVIILAAVVFAVGALACAFAPSVSILIIGRIAIGVAIGIASYTAPLYISEVAPPDTRGMLVSLNQLAITIGIVCSYLTDYLFSHSGNWRAMLGVGVFPAILLLLGMIFLPESPRWLMLKGRDEKAIGILQRIRKGLNISKELEEIRETLKIEKSALSSFSQMRTVMPVLLVGCILMVFQQIDGINTIIYYAPTIFKLSGFQDNTVAILATLGVGIVNVLFTVIALPLLDRWGRRPLLFIGVSAMAVSLLALGYAFHTHSQHGALQWITLASLVVYIAGFAISLGPIAWLIAAELFPLKARGLGMSIVTATNWGFNMIVAVTFLTLLQNFGGGNTFWLYGALSILTLFFVYFFVPETKNITLEQIEMHLAAGVRVRDLGKKSA